MSQLHLEYITDLAESVHTDGTKEIFAQQDCFGSIIREVYYLEPKFAFAETPAIDAIPPPRLWPTMITA